MKLTIAQRYAVQCMDVLGYTERRIAEEFDKMWPDVVVSGNYLDGKWLLEEANDENA